ncbi:Sec20-domain-containing protein [Cristinia sonorae]|uniref:Sec20-domain-containing protein n=1 Tax=Cristinia sonorae TaxID=1940300 RepID=A0A8K0UPK4_9AGAR|nr:Sec20-domain-containing protein [Cristinia sonorae]
MAPIPSVLPSEIQERISSLTRKEKDIFEFQIPRLRDCKGTLATQQQYAAELREDVDGFARDVDGLDTEVDDLKGERSRRELRVVVSSFRDSLTRMRKETRSALLTSKRAIDANSTSNREELFRSAAVREKQDLNEKVTEDALMEASNNVTEALQRTIALMQGELEKSVLSTQLLDASTATLKSTSTTHDVLDNLMVTSKHLITALEKSDWLDRLLIFAALAFFVLVVLFILKQRLVDRSLRIALFWTRFLPSSSSGKSAASVVKDRVVDVMEKGTAVTGSVVVTTTAVSSILSAASSAAASMSSPSDSFVATVLVERPPDDPFDEIVVVVDDETRVGTVRT